MSDFETHPVGTAKRIEALTEQLAAAQQDAKEAEDYAKEVEADRKKTYEALLKVSRIHGEAEAKLAKAVEALEAGVICTTKHGGAAEFLRIARTTLTELKGGTSGKD
jgi:predicted  nucleic acid-binding Zn-ribbon protein